MTNHWIDFKNADVSVLVATDIAARGLDIPLLPYVINFELPNVPEDYVHRIGRTGRAGSSGMAISFCDIEERPYLKDIEKLIQQKITVVHEHPFINDTLETVSVEPEREHGHKRKPKPNPKKKSSGKNNYWRKRATGTRKPS